MPTLLIDLVLGITLLATIGLAATHSALAAPTPGRRLIGWLGIAVPLPLVVACRLFEPSSPLGGQRAFAAGALAFAVGAVLLLGSRGQAGDDGREADPPTPPWWPDFESEFRAYARSQPGSRVRT